MALSSANRCYDFPLAEPGQSKRRARFFCVDGRKRSDAGQVRVRGGSDGKYGNAVLATTGCRLSSKTATCAILSGQRESYYPAGH